MSLPEWYVAVFSVGVGLTIPVYWALNRADRLHVTREILAGAVLLAAGVSMLAGSEDSGWVRVLSGVGLGMLVYSLIESPGRYRGRPGMRTLFGAAWVFTILAVILRFISL